MGTGSRPTWRVREILVEHHHRDHPGDRLVIGVCNKSAQGGGLNRTR